MYNLAVCAVFKNESHVLKDWLNHYIRYGVEHFYLINDESSDDYMHILEPYIDKGFITLYQNTIPKLINNQINKNRQEQIYNYYCLNDIKLYTKWICVVDLDEFIYSPKNIKITEVLEKYNSYSQISVDWLMFGSNGNDRQPQNILTVLIKRSNIIYSYKSIIKVEQLQRLGIHSSQVVGSSIRLNINQTTYDADLICNHYRVQSREHWDKVMKRGDADCNGSISWRDWKIFELYDHNEVEDMRLANQVAEYNSTTN